MLGSQKYECVDKGLKVTTYDGADPSEHSLVVLCPFSSVCII